MDTHFGTNSKLYYFSNQGVHYVFWCNLQTIFQGTCRLQRCKLHIIIFIFFINHRRQIKCSNKNVLTYLSYLRDFSISYILYITLILQGEFVLFMKEYIISLQETNKFYLIIIIVKIIKYNLTELKRNLTFQIPFDDTFTVSA